MFFSGTFVKQIVSFVAFVNYFYMADLTPGACVIQKKAPGNVHKVCREMFCSSFLSATVIKRSDQSSVGSKSLFGFHFPFSAHPWGKSTQGPDAENGGILLVGCLSDLLSTWITHLPNYPISNHFMWFSAVPSWQCKQGHYSALPVHCRKSGKKTFLNLENYQANPREIKILNLQGTTWDVG